MRKLPSDLQKTVDYESVDCNIVSDFETKFNCKQMYEL